MEHGQPIDGTPTLVPVPSRMNSPRISVVNASLGTPSALPPPKLAQVKDNRKERQAQLQVFSFQFSVFTFHFSLFSFQTGVKRKLKTEHRKLKTHLSPLPATGTLPTIPPNDVCSAMFVLRRPMLGSRYEHRRGPKTRLAGAST
jgi:hypothetical protein